MKKLDKDKKIIIIVINFVLIILLVSIIILHGNKRKEEKKNNNAISDIKLVDNLDVEINEEINLLSFVRNKEDIDIVSDDIKISTDVLGSKELVIKYKKDEKILEYKFKINVVDTIKPVIEAEDEIVVTVGEKRDLLKDVKVLDNSLEEITPFIEGEYDLNKEGTYNLKYVAIDSSNNKVVKDFVLIVNGSLDLNEENNVPTEEESNPLENENVEQKEENNESFGEAEGYVNPNERPDAVASSESWTERRLEADKYGAKIYAIDDYLKITYNNRREEIRKNTKYELDSSGFNGTVQTLRSEAESIVDANWALYQEHVNIVNSYRAEKNIHPLELDRNLSIAATMRSMEMVYTNTFTHDRPNGNKQNILTEMGINYYAFGENILAGYEIDTAPEAAERWKTSDPHYRNMIYEDFNKIGIGYVFLDCTDYKNYWTQVFSD